MKAHYFEFNLCNTFSHVFYICIWDEIFLRFTLRGTFFFFLTNESLIWMLSTVWGLGFRKVSRLPQTAV